MSEKVTLMMSWLGKVSLGSETINHTDSLYYKLKVWILKDLDINTRGGSNKIELPLSCIMVHVGSSVFGV